MNNKKEQLNRAFDDPEANIDKVKQLLELLRQTLLEVGTDVYQSMSSEERDSFEAAFAAKDEESSILSQVDRFEEKNTHRALVNLEQEDKIINIDDLESDTDETMIDEALLSENSFDDYEVVD